MAVRKTKEGASLKRWFKEKWTDEKGNPCGSKKGSKVKKCRPSRRVSSKTPVTWKEMSSKEKKKAVERRNIFKYSLGIKILPLFKNFI